MAFTELDLALARLDGFLKAFEWFNHKANHGCSFYTVSIPQKRDDVSATLAGYFERQGWQEDPISAQDFPAVPLADIEREVRATFARFLFLFVEEHGDRLEDPRESFTLMDECGQEMLLDEITKTIRELNATAAWRVRPTIACEGLREHCFQDDLVLELRDRLCLIHFGVSD